MVAGRHILLIIGGGIAAYKALETIRRLKERGCVVTPVMTRAAGEFVTPLSVSALAGRKVFSDLFDLTDEAEMGHIELSRAADLVVVAPCTADLMAKIAGGHADDLASTLLIATDKRVLIAPSMNVRMWEHPATQRNLATLQGDGILIVGPNSGDMACGEYGPGRMAEPMEILEAVGRAFAGGPLAGRRVLVTSGPTHEPIDPVRLYRPTASRRAGGGVGRALADLGAEVVFVTGPPMCRRPEGVEVVACCDGGRDGEAVHAALPVEAAVFAAAVADWRVAEASTSKIKKRMGEKPILHMAENPDILAEIAGLGRTGRASSWASPRRPTRGGPCHGQAVAQGLRLDPGQRCLRGTGIMGGTETRFSSSPKAARSAGGAWARCRGAPAGGPDRRGAVRGLTSAPSPACPGGAPNGAVTDGRRGKMSISGQMRRGA